MTTLPEVPARRKRQPPAPATALLLLAIIVIAAAALRIYTFRGFVGLDDGEYVTLARQLAAGIPQTEAYGGPAVFPLRVGLTVPAAAALRTFGVGEWPMVLYPFVLSLALVALAYACASVLFDRRAGLLAAGLTAVMTWQVEAATTLLPDLPGTFFGAAGVTILFAALRADLRRRGALAAAGLAAGLAFGASWLCKESILYLVPFCAALMAITVRQHGRGVAWLWGGVAAGSIAVFAGEMAVYARLTGDPLFRLAETERNYVQNAKYFFTEGSRYGWASGESYARAVVHRIFVTGPTILLANRQALFMPLVALAAGVYAILRRDRAFLLPSLWLWSLALMFNFASSSLSAYTPLVLFHRYVLPVFFAATIVSAGFLSRLLVPPGPVAAAAPRGWRALGWAAAAVLIWVGSTEVYWAAKYRPRSWAADVRVLARTVQPDRPVLADTLTLRGLTFFTQYPATTAWHDFEELGRGAQIAPGTLVVVNHRYLTWLEVNGGLWGQRTRGYAKHAFYERAPDGWTVVWKGAEALVYEVGPRAVAATNAE
jgi:hypothetical protein